MHFFDLVAMKYDVITYSMFSSSRAVMIKAVTNLTVTYPTTLKWGSEQALIRETIYQRKQSKGFQGEMLGGCISPDKALYCLMDGCIDG